jgi:hypothetical protein
MRCYLKYSFFVFALLLTTQCSELLEPEPIDLLTDDTVLNEPKDVPNVEVGLYSAFRNIIPSVVIAGDCTADMLLFNGTFNQYRELGTKQITSANASALSLWGSIYNTVYIANFILERLPDVPGVPAAQREQVLATAHFLRGYAYFVGLYSFGGMPLVTETAIDANRNIPRATEDAMLTFILDDYNAAVGKLPAQPANAGFAGRFALDAAFAKYYLYIGNWAKAEQHATDVISSNQFLLEPNYATLVTEDFTDEAIFEMGYTIADDPGTSATGLNNVFVGRREMIPSNEVIVALATIESGERFSSIRFRADLLKGNDNGWSVAKYGTADEDNNNVVVFRLGEMYLIRAEARTQQGKVTEARADINLLRGRAKAPLIPTVNQSQMIQIIETERRYELAFEGHRWFDLVRTGRAKTVMNSFSANWKDTYELWPIPQREVQNNPSLVGNQNPGY